MCAHAFGSPTCFLARKTCSQSCQFSFVVPVEKDLCIKKSWRLNYWFQSSSCDCALERLQPLPLHSNEPHTTNTDVISDLTKKETTIEVAPCLRVHSWSSVTFSYWVLHGLSVAGV